MNPKEQVGQKGQHEPAQARVTCFCVHCKGLKVQKEGMRDLHMHQWGSMSSSHDASTSQETPTTVNNQNVNLPTSNTSQNARTNRAITSNARVITQTATRVVEQDYTIGIPKLLALQTKHGVSDAAIDELLSTLHNKIMHPGNTCPGSIKEARELVAKSSRPS